MSLVDINWKPAKQELRLFGLAGTAVFALLAAMATAKTTPVVTGVMWGAIGVWTILAIIRPKYLLPAHVVITAVSLPIGIVVSYAILGVLYFGVFTPIALVFRLIGRDPLHRRFDASAKTYWTPRRPVEDVRRYYRQF